MEDVHVSSAEKPARRPPWNKGKIVGAKPALRPSHVWSIRTELQIEGRKWDLALFNLAIDSSCACWSTASNTTRAPRRPDSHSPISNRRRASALIVRPAMPSAAADTRIRKRQMEDGPPIVAWHDLTANIAR